MILYTLTRYSFSAVRILKKTFNCYSSGNNISELYNLLEKFPFIKSKAVLDNWYIKIVDELFYELPYLRLRILPGADLGF